MDLILASTSPYRRSLLQRLQLPFRCLSPTTDESPLPDEAPAALAARLAAAKAHSVATLHPDSLVIGSDQVAALGGRMLGKPGNHARAREQLLASAGQPVQFFTGLALCCQARGFEEVMVEPFTVHFRPLDGAAIDNYLTREQPFDCAGSFKWEGLGIALFERMSGDDPTSLEGLPLIALTSLLQRAGYPVLA